MKKIMLLPIAALLVLATGCPIPTTDNSHIMANYSFSGTSWQKIEPDMSCAIVETTCAYAADGITVISETTRNIIVLETVETLTFSKLGFMEKQGTFTYTRDIRFTPGFNAVIFNDDIDTADGVTTTYDLSSAIIPDLSQPDFMSMLMEGLVINAGITYSGNSGVLYSEVFTGTYRKRSDDLLNVIYFLESNNQRVIANDLDPTVTDAIYSYVQTPGNEQSWPLEPDNPDNQTRLAPRTNYLVMKDTLEHYLDSFYFSTNRYDPLDGTSAPEDFILKGFTRLPDAQ